jgi:UDP-N-acetylglucosamine acyltransferase
MAMHIDPLASVSPHAEIDPGVEIGPFCVIGPNVRIAEGTQLQGHVTVVGHTVIGMHNRIFPGAVIGAEPQDVSYDGSPTRVEIGDHNVIRECVTINRATTKEQGLTSVGNYNYLMACSHVAHDCVIGNHVILANSVLLGGHVHIHDYAILSGHVGVHHYATVGAYSFVGGQSRIVHDVPPYMLVDGNPSSVRYLNLVGLKRHGLSAEEIASLSEAHRLIYRAKMGLRHATELLESHGHLTSHVRMLLEFIRQQYDGSHGRAGEARRKVA